MRAPARRHSVVRAASPAKESIEFEDLVDVIRAVDASDVIEMDLKGKKFAINVKKQEALEPPETVYVPQPMAAAPAGTLSATHRPYMG